MAKELAGLQTNTMYYSIPHEIQPHLHWSSRADLTYRSLATYEQGISLIILDEKK